MEEEAIDLCCRPEFIEIDEVHLLARRPAHHLHRHQPATAVPPLLPPPSAGLRTREHGREDVNLSAPVVSARRANIGRSLSSASAGVRTIHISLDSAGWPPCQPHHRGIPSRHGHQVWGSRGAHVQHWAIASPSCTYYLPSWRPLRALRPRGPRREHAPPAGDRVFATPDRDGRRVRDAPGKWIVK